jgi:peptide/nickel transport system substrate-binding protein
VAWINPGLRGYNYDPERAKALLAEAGYAEGQLNISIWAYSERPELPTIALAIQDMLKKIGVAAEVRVAPYASMEADVLGGSYDLFLLSRGYLVDVYDPEGFLAADYTCEGSYNLSNYCNEAYDALISQARTLDSPEDRYALYRQAQAILLDEDAVDVFLTYEVRVFAHNNAVVNYRPHLLAQYTLTPELDVSR